MEEGREERRMELGREEERVEKINAQRNVD